MKTLAYLMATHQLAAGTLGALPWEPAKFALMAFNGLGFTDQTWGDFQKYMQDYYTKIAGKVIGPGRGANTIGDMLANGVSRGIPGGMGFDMSSRVGLDSLMTFGEPRSMDQAGVKSYLFDLLGGAGTGTIGDAWSGASQLLDGNIGKAMQLLMPVKMASDTAKAITESQAGHYNPQDFGLKVMGLTSARQANISHQIGSDIRASGQKKDEQKALTKDYMDANTPGAKGEAIRAISNYNRTNPKGAKDISVRALDKYKRKDMKVYADNP